MTDENVDDAHEDGSCQNDYTLDDDDFNDQSDIVVEMPPGAKPKTKHIFVAPLISFYGCVPYPKGQQTPVFGRSSGSAPVGRKSEQRHVTTKNLCRTVIG